MIPIFLSTFKQSRYFEHLYTATGELERFEHGVQRLRSVGYQVECPFPYGAVINPVSLTSRPNARKPIDLTITGSIHGNERAGLAVLNHLLDLLASGLVNIPFKLALAVGNPKALLQNIRYVEKDLNRSFGAQSSGAWESLRARDLEAFLSQTQYYLDIHQTTEPSERPFFIFPYESKSYAFARAIEPRYTIVTHWGKPFSTSGECSDEYVQRQDGIGITLELGQASFDPSQISCGVTACLRAFAVVAAYIQGKPLVSTQLNPIGDLFTYLDPPVPYPKSWLDLKEGLYNFCPIKEGDVLGSLESGDVVKAPSSGRALFPQYFRDKAQYDPAAKELMRLLIPLAEDALPSS